MAQFVLHRIVFFYILKFSILTQFGSESNKKACGPNNIFVTPHISLLGLLMKKTQIVYKNVKIFSDSSALVKLTFFHICAFVIHYPIWNCFLNIQFCVNIQSFGFKSSNLPVNTLRDSETLILFSTFHKRAKSCGSVWVHMPIPIPGAPLVFLLKIQLKFVV